MSELDLELCDRRQTDVQPALDAECAEPWLPVAELRAAAEAQAAWHAQVERLLAVTRRYFAAPLADGEHPALEPIDAVAVRRSRRSAAVLAHRRAHPLALRRLLFRRRAVLLPVA